MSPGGWTLGTDTMKTKTKRKKRVRDAAEATRGLAEENKRRLLRALEAAKSGGNSQDVSRTQCKDKERIKAALQRIEEGTYGYCEQCGLKLPEAQLAAAPCAIRCISCAQ